MQANRLSIGLRALAIFTVTLLVTSAWAATNWQEKVLHSFNNNGTDGDQPYAGLTLDAAGNLYGTTFAGGAYNLGTVFELTPTQGGGWSETVLYSFGSYGTDGSNPIGGLIFDAAGNLYGTTNFGGTSGWGTVFELTPTGSGGWTEMVLYSFCSQANCTDGIRSLAGLIFDAAGNLYGTTIEGGAYGNGTAFELTPTGGGGWTEQVLYSFGTDGEFPLAGLIFDAAGNLYGTTKMGGIGYWGTAFELSPNGNGGWTETVLCSFGVGGNGNEPYAGLIFDTAGNLYGTTLAGGAYGYGTVFELTPTQGGGWSETVLHSFNPETEGYGPTDSLIFDKNGNLYGTASEGGDLACNPTYGCGMTFELTPTAGGGWTEQVLFNFNGTDGANPSAGLIFDAAGNLYGTTNLGGAYGGGVVFEVSPVRPCVFCSHIVSSREADVLPAERTALPEQGEIERR